MRKIIVGIAAFSMMGCATILNEDLQKINVSSSADKIKGNIDGIPFEGPGIVAVKRTKGDRIINVETAGCQKQTVLASTVDPKFLSIFYAAEHLDPQLTMHLRKCGSFKTKL